MKKSSTFISILWRSAKSIAIAVAFYGATNSTNAQTTFQVDSTKPWGGFMNVFAWDGTSVGGYQFGSGWGISDLRGFFTGTSSLTLQPCSNVFNPTDLYWANPDGSGAKWMDASFYVDVGTSQAGQTVSFVGSVISNTLIAPYSSVAVIKEFAPGYAFVGQTTAALVTGQPFSVVRSIGAGNITQYGFVTTGPDVSPANFAAAGKVVIAVNNADPNVGAVAGQGVVEGQTAHFTVAASGTAPLSYQWSYISPTTTNVLSNGAHYSGVTTSNLTIANVVSADAGMYSVTVKNGVGTNKSAGTLTVIPLALAQTNMLLDPGFEDAALAYDSTAGWYPFNGAIQVSTNDYYYFSPFHVVSYEGSNTVQIYSGGDYNGIFQDRPVTPGQVYTASAKFFVSDQDQISGSNVCYLEVQFRDSGNAVLRQYSSTNIDVNTPMNTWITLAPTNVHAGDFVTSLGTSPYMVAPAGSAYARFQVTYHSLGSGGSVYVDNTSLQLKEPVTTAVRSGNNVNISFPTLYGPSYKVLYKANLSDATWSTLTTVTGDGTTKTVSDSIASHRYYTVNTQ